MCCAVESSNKDAHKQIAHPQNAGQHFNNVASMMLTDSRSDNQWTQHFIADIWNAVFFERVYGYMVFDMYPGNLKPCIINPIFCAIPATIKLERGVDLTRVSTEVLLVPSTITLSQLVAAQGPSRDSTHMPKNCMTTHKHVISKLQERCANNDPSWKDTVVAMFERPEETSKDWSFDEYDCHPPATFEGFEWCMSCIVWFLCAIIALMMWCID